MSHRRGVNKRFRRSTWSSRQIWTFASCVGRQQSPLFCLATKFSSILRHHSRNLVISIKKCGIFISLRTYMYFVSKVSPVVLSSSNKFSLWRHVHLRNLLCHKKTITSFYFPRLRLINCQKFLEFSK